MQKISGPSVTVAYLGNCIFRYLHDFGQIGGLPISPKWTNWKNFQQFPVKNLKLNGVSFMKNGQLLYLGPHILVVLTKSGLPISQECTNLIFFYNFPDQLQIERGAGGGSVFLKNCTI